MLWTQPPPLNRLISFDMLFLAMASHYWPLSRNLTFDMAKKWYTAVLVLGCRVDSVSGRDPLVDLQIRILQAENNDDAYRISLEIGKQAETTYFNNAGERVLWTFHGLRDLEELECAPEHGVEIYSIRQRENPTNLVMERSKLGVFWAEDNKLRTASEIIESMEDEPI